MNIAFVSLLDTLDVHLYEWLCARQFSQNITLATHKNTNFSILFFSLTDLQQNWYGYSPSLLHKATTFWFVHDHLPTDFWQDVYKLAIHVHVYVLAPLYRCLPS